MKKISFPFLIYFSLLLSFNCSNKENKNKIVAPFSNETKDNSSKELFNVSYGTNSQQVYDLYLPANRNEDTKLIVLIHGGGWTSGDKSNMNSYKTIAKQDLPSYAIVNINYRLASQGVSPFPMQLDDITLVVNHLKEKQLDYNISDQIGFIGVSAGAHLALLWSYNYDTGNQVNMVGSIVGPTDLADANYTDNPRFPVNDIIRYFGESPTQEFLELYSPLHKVTTLSPPTILFYGGDDALIPTSQGVNMDLKLSELNVIHEFTLHPKEGHTLIGRKLIDTWTKLKTFVATHH